LNVAAAGLTHASLMERLTAAGADAAADKLVGMLEHCDAARFAPGSAAPERMAALLRQAESLVTGLEESWNRRAKRFAVLLVLLGCGLVGVAPGSAAAQKSPAAPGESLLAQPLQVQRSPAPDFMPPAETLQRAHAAYEAGRYQEAVAAYKQAEALGVRNGPLYYDLGNAHYKSGQLGEAIAAYRRAERLMPRDALVRANLAFVLARREDKAVQPAVPFPLTLLRALYRWMSLNEWILFTTGLYVLACAAGIYRIVKRDRRLVVRLALAGLVASFGLAGAALAYKIHDERGIARAVVVADKVSVMSGPGKDYTVEFWLHEGSEVQIEEFRPEWLRVSMGANLHGWIRAASVVRI
jgi:tetratricopeptide (TPR) repeat protein